MIEVERKDVTMVKLTIAHDGKVRLKIPPRFNDAEVEVWKTKAEEAVKARGPQEKTLRIKLGK